MTYAEAKKRLDEWYCGENVDISPEVLDCCYDALKKVMYDNIDIRKLILDSAPPLEWVGDINHPIHLLGYYHFGVCDGFTFNENSVKNASEEILKEIYGEIARYWCDQGIGVDKYKDYIHL